ncbi:MAG: thioesterase family protein [Pirellulales bacterium]|nr:thioesterase family protein [Pirellulales bacterium]
MPNQVNVNTFNTTRRVEFAMTDAAGIMHFAAFFELMESVEHELLRSLGLSVMPPADSPPPHLSWPRVSATCDFRQAVRFEDVLDIKAWVARLGTKSITYAFEFLCGEALVAEGQIVAVCCQVAHGKLLSSQPVPQSWSALLRPYVRV